MTATNFLWDFATDSYLMEKDDGGNTTAVYTNEPVKYGELVSQRRGGTTSYYHFDGQWSTRQLTDHNGNITDVYTYTAFGEMVTSTGSTANNFRFVGGIEYYYDLETVSYYVRARSYDVVTARWLSPDPSDITMASENLQQTPAPTIGAACTVVVECVRLLYLGGIHCGLRVTSAGTTTSYHVLGGSFGATCAITGTRVSLGISGQYWDQDTIGAHPSACACIAANAARITAANLPYFFIPGNYCDSNPTCNSNYTTKCLLHHCGLSSSIDRWWFKPVGWGHRMERCTQSVKTRQGCCLCFQWQRIDNAWCSTRTPAQVQADPAG